MIRPEYNGPKENPLTRAEGIELTVALGNAHRGDDYYNADVFGRVIHFGGANYIEQERDRDPEAFATRVDNQVEKIQAIVAPFIGRWAAAKHCKLGLKNEPSWELWERVPYRTPVMHTSGIILGAAGVAMDRTMTFDHNHPDDLSKAYESYKGPDFKVGIILDTTFANPSFAWGVEAPDTDRMLVPIRGFPVKRESFHGIWSWQISGVR